MIFTKITLHNFGIYAGRHEIDLAPEKDRRIVLFGALNGSGKTTLLEGIQFALYGRNSRFLASSKTTYTEFLQNSVNRNSLEDSASVGLTFTALRNGSRSEFEVVRTWGIRGKAIKEYPLQVFRDSELNEELSGRWEEFVESFFPNQLSELFFFDGEKIENLAQPSQCAEIIKTGLNSLLGLDLVTDLTKTLSVLDRRIQITTVTQAEKQALDRAEAEVQSAQERRREQERELHRLNELLERVNLELSGAKDELKKQGGDLFIERENFKTRETQLLKSLEQHKHALIEFSASKAPLLIIKRELQELEEHCSQGLTQDQFEAAQEALKTFSKTLVGELEKDQAFSKEHIKRLKEFQNAYLNSQESRAERPNVSVSKELLIRTRTELDAVKSEGYRLLVELGKLDTELQSTQSTLIAVPDEQKLSPQLLQVSELEKRQRSIISEIRAYEIQRDRSSHEIANASIALDKLETQLTEKRAEEERVRLMRARLQSGKAILPQFAEKVRNKNISALERKIKECLDLLIRKKNFVSEVTIDKDSYLLTINVTGKGPIPAMNLSAGERQLLAVSVLWGLASLSGRELPAIVDTPLGRLDSNSRKNLIENYFPHAGRQVILLSTDEEIVDKYYKSLKPHLARQYVIEYDDTQQSSVVHKGYFGNLEVAA